MLSLFSTVLWVVGKVNFTNLSRYSPFCERTFRRHFSQVLPFTQFNRGAYDLASTPEDETIAVMDATFLPKSGGATFGVGKFYNGVASRVERGLELSVLALVNVSQQEAYALSVRQMPAPETVKSTPKRPESEGEISAEQVEASRQLLSNLPVRAPARISSAQVEAARADLEALPARPLKPTCFDHFLTQLKQDRSALPPNVKYLAVDCYYTNSKFVSGVLSCDLHQIGKLRLDANLRHPYSGPQKPRGAPRKYADKVRVDNPEAFEFVQELEPHLRLYTAVVWHLSLKRQIRIVLLVNTRNPSKPGYVLLFSTDLDLDALKLLKYYQARFQIEFIFRDAKQFTGLCEAQTQNEQRLNFHFNLSFSVLNWVKCYHHQQHHDQTTATAPGQSEKGEKSQEKLARVPFSMASYKRIALNQHLADVFIEMFDIDSTLIKSHPNYQKLCNYGSIAA